MEKANDFISDDISSVKNLIASILDITSQSFN